MLSALFGQSPAVVAAPPAPLFPAVPTLPAVPGFPEGDDEPHAIPISESVAKTVARFQEVFMAVLRCGFETRAPPEPI
jgi:hypothetical protein